MPTIPPPAPAGRTLTLRLRIIAATLISLLSLAAANASSANAELAEGDVKITQVRNATLLIEYAGTTFLLDPMLGAKGSMPPLLGQYDTTTRNPTVELPIPASDLLDADAVIATHLHVDHFDDAAMQLLPKSKPIFVQDETDATKVRGAGFTDVRVMTQNSTFNGIGLAKTDGRHGDDAAYAKLGDALGNVSGVVFHQQGHETVYVAGDTIFNGDVQAAISEFEPDVIVLNVGYAISRDVGPILMGKQDTLTVHQAAPSALLIASHLEAVNHTTLTRADLRDFAVDNALTDTLLIPRDGEQIIVEPNQ